MRRAAWFVAAMLLLAALAHAVQAESGVARLHAEGTPEAVGRQVGEAYAERLQRLHPVFLRVAKHAGNLNRDQLYAAAKRFEPYLAAEDITEMKSLAAASGLFYEDVLFLNTFYSLTADRIACRQIAVWGDHSDGGMLIHARNLDWIDYPGDPLKSDNLILNVKPDNGVEYLVLTWPGLTSALTGTNRAGLTVAFNTLPGRSARRDVSEPTFFTLKRVLRSCSTIGEAVALIRKARPFGNGSVMISHSGERRAVVVELIDGRVGVRSDRRGMIGNANHATRESGVRPSTTPIASADAPVCEVARAIGPKFDPQSITRVMSHPKVMLATNMLSVVFVPEANKMWLSCGQNRAAAGEFVAFELFEN